MPDYTKAFSIYILKFMTPLSLTSDENQQFQIQTNFEYTITLIGTVQILLELEASVLSWLIMYKHLLTQVYSYNANQIFMQIENNYLLERRPKYIAQQ